MSATNIRKSDQRAHTVIPRPPYHFHCVAFGFVQRSHIFLHDT